MLFDTSNLVYFFIDRGIVPACLGMAARNLDGKWLASVYQQAISNEVLSLRERCRRAPGLAVIIVGDNPASKAYVASKEKTAKKCGFETFDAKLPASASFDQVAEAIKKFNDDPRVDGILMQLPLPAGLPEEKLLDLIRPDKDADGLHPLNQGLLARGEGDLRPCTPRGAMRLIDVAYSECSQTGELDPLTQIPEVSLSGKKAIVVGRSILVGKPIALLLLERNATVTLAHSKSPSLAALCREADILVAAVGRPGLVKGDWIKEGAVVVDVGINRLDDGRLVGDVDFESARERAIAITPVPGGVGPMTVTMLIFNTLQAFKKREKLLS